MNIPLFLTKVLLFIFLSGILRLTNLYLFLRKNYQSWKARNPEQSGLRTYYSFARGVDPKWYPERNIESGRGTLAAITTFLAAFALMFFIFLAWSNK